MCVSTEAQSRISAPCRINVEHLLHMEMMFMEQWVEAAAGILNPGS